MCRMFFGFFCECLLCLPSLLKLEKITSLSSTEVGYHFKKTLCAPLLMKIELIFYELLIYNKYKFICFTQSTFAFVK
jgi:hypothetical protein